MFSSKCKSISEAPPYPSMFSCDNTPFMNRSSTQSKDKTINNEENGGAPALYKLIEQDLFSMREYVDHVNLHINQAHEKLLQLKTRGRSETELDELKKLKKVVAKMKTKIPSQDKIHYVDFNSHRKSWPDINKSSNEMMPNLYKEPKFEHIIEPQDLPRALDQLPFTALCCLLCFCMFPPMSILKRRFLVYWWIGNGLVSRYMFKHCITVEPNEDVGNEIFDMLIAEGFIEPVYQKCSFVPDSGRLSPYFHSYLNIHKTRAIYALGQVNGFQSPHTYEYMINYGNSIIDGGPKLLEEMENLKICYLGRWHSSTTHHIEVADNKILYGLKKLKYLTFLSLQGISLITELPQIISELTSLEILDLRACHNLEVIPDGIGFLRNLTHLDMSECYFLEYMPKSLCNLSGLEVLKGFLIADSKYNQQSCTLNDLSGLPKLRKLNIYTSVKEFPTERHLIALGRFMALRKLTISWGGCSLLSKNDAGKQEKDNGFESLASGIKYPGTEEHGKNEPDPTKEAITRPNSFLKRLLTIQSGKPSAALPSSLQKLDLQCFRGTSPPTWLRPANLKQLKKLYIRGGQLCDLGQFENLIAEGQWSVEILRLKYLSDLQMNWEELMMLFPKLNYFHRVECPKLMNFPFDDDGRWIDIKEEVP